MSPEKQARPGRGIERTRKASIAIALSLGTLCGFPGKPCGALQAAPLKVFTAGSSGTAFVLGPTEEGRCILLTARHVVDNSRGGEPIEITSISGQRIKLLNSSFIKSQDLDLAFLPMPDCSLTISLPLARARGISVGMKVILTGYPLTNEQNDSIRPEPATASGRITQYNDSIGYDLSYDAATAIGYSGGPVVSAESRSLLGIHGRSDNVGDTADRAKVGGRGISAPLLYRELRKNGFTLTRSVGSPCFTGVCP